MGPGPLSHDNVENYWDYILIVPTLAPHAGQFLEEIYHTVNRLRSFLSLGHSVTRSLGLSCHPVTIIFNIVTD